MSIFSYRTILLLFLAGSAYAHIPLTPAILDDAFEDLQLARAAADATTTPEKQAPAVYEFAIKATDLMMMLNQEIRLHGTERQDLLDEAVAGAARLGIEITWSKDHQRYFYTGSAYRRYLELMPDGLNAMNSRYHLIETGFYRGSSENQEELAARAATEKEFLHRYPEVENSRRVAMFLAIDYRDIWRICRATDDRECMEHYAKLIREHLSATSARYAEEKTGQLARTLLQRYEQEAAEAP